MLLAKPERRRLQDRLAACVNIVPGLRSIYRWEGQVEAVDEVLLLVKTSAEAGDDRRYP